MRYLLERDELNQNGVKTRSVQPHPANPSEIGRPEEVAARHIEVALRDLLVVVAIVIPAAWRIEIGHDLPDDQHVNGTNAR